MIVQARIQTLTHFEFKFFEARLSYGRTEIQTRRQTAAASPCAAAPLANLMLPEAHVRRNTASASASASASALFVSLRLQASKGSKDPVCCSSSSSSSSSSLEPHSDRVRASGLLHGGDGFPPSRACFHVSKQAREQACVEPSREPSAVESLSFRRDALISRRTSC
eukprot:CAMPEP_0171553980 /NCGR_PEP_ID=MMETSP0960-20121227/9253_1 /TAXON_ID=87120 /ORGANISM="Aurantiochytrium limacinum, Strain ATCCMYA-1381" /LENGTH=165 /DNA_ID=CAMNT_0012103751 /DNA_START=32 /DNA_END=527 /DNA_ORIENTATION=+